jgi:hypothetical protein
VPPPSTNSGTSILFMSKTKIGFEEKLAEFVAQYYPDLKLGSEKYKKTFIHCYRGEKESRSFSYLRFGRTVFISLRSSDTGILKKIVDREKDSSIPSLFDKNDFQEFKSEINPGGSLSSYINPALFIKYLKAVKKESGSETLENTLPFIEQVLKPFRMAELNFTLDKGLNGNISFKYKKGFKNKTNISDPKFKTLEYTGKNAAAFIIFKDHNTGKSLENIIFNLLIHDEADENKNTMANDLKQIFQNYIFPHIKGEVLIYLERMTPGLIVPMFTGDIIIEVNNIKKAVRDTEKLFMAFGAAEDKNKKPIIMTPSGIIRYSQEKEFLRLNIQSGREKQIKKATGKNIESNALFSKLYPEGQAGSKLMVYINFRRISQDLEKLAARSIRWNKKTRKRVKRFRKWAAVCGYLGGCALWDEPEDEKIVYEFRIPVE